MRAGAGFLRSVVARRLLALLLVTALLPVGVAAWLSHAAIAELTRQVDVRLIDRATRQVGLQVFDRLLVAKGVVQTWPEPETLVAGQASVSLPGQGRLFKAIVGLDGQGQPLWSVGDGDVLAQQWRARQPVAALAAAVRERHVSVLMQGQTQEVNLRLLNAPGQPPRVALAVGPAAAPIWLAEVDAAYLWSPIVDSGDAAWSVTDVAGRALATFAGDADAATSGAPLRQSEYSLFLGAEFGADDWRFTQRQKTTSARWAGQPLEVWLALVAAATVLGLSLIHI